MASSYALNKMARTVSQVDKHFPARFRPWGYSAIFNIMVKLAGTAGIYVEEMSRSTAVVSLKNRRKVQNHIGGIHACGMALVSESATGIVVGMNVPDNALPLCKSMKVNFIRRCVGDIKAVAHLTDEQLHKIHTEPKGDVLVDVKVTDSTGQSPITAEMVWAWVPKDRKPRESKGTVLVEGHLEALRLRLNMREGQCGIHARLRDRECDRPCKYRHERPCPRYNRAGTESVLASATKSAEKVTNRAAGVPRFWAWRRRNGVYRDHEAK